MKSEYQRLINQWARWSRETFRYGHCGSIEHKYLSPQCWESPEPRPPEINLKEVMQVERAVIQLPDKHRIVLIWSRVHRVKEPWAIARQAKKRHRVWVNPHKVEDLIYEAEKMVSNRLRNLLQKQVSYAIR